MSDCARIDSLVTPFIDGELPAGERAFVETHLVACALCRSRVDVERSIHELLVVHRLALCASPAPDTLRTRCQPPAASPVSAARGPARSWRARAVPLALAATLVVALAGLIAYRLTQAPVRLMAAELTTDHVKCFLLHGRPDSVPAAGDVEKTLARMFDWDASLPAAPEEVGLELVGARPCLYAEGRVAHIMYRHEGRPVSVFMLPDRERVADLMDVLGHQAVAWTSGGRTFVLVAREPPAEMDRIARFVHAGLR